MTRPSLPPTKPRKPKLKLKVNAGSYGGTEGAAKDTGKYASSRVGADFPVGTGGSTVGVRANARGGSNRFRAPGMQESKSDQRFTGVGVRYKNPRKGFTVTGEVSDDMRAPGQTSGRGSKGAQISFKKKF